MKNSLKVDLGDIINFKALTLDQLTKKQNRALTYYLTANKNKETFFGPAQITFNTAKGKSTYQFELNDYIYRRNSEYAPQITVNSSPILKEPYYQDRFEVYEGETLASSIKNVHVIKFTIVPQLDGTSLINKHHPRIVKMIDADSIKNKYVKREYELTNILPDRSCKKPVFADDYTYLTMKKLDGVDLTLLHQPLISNMLQLLINLSYALKEQVHDRNIIHRDLKPENILINPKTLEAHVIDFGLSKIKDEITNESVGTEGYTSPEQKNYFYYMKNGASDTKDLQKKYCTSFISDFFSFAILLGEILNAKNPHPSFYIPGLAYNYSILFNHYLSELKNRVDFTQEELKKIAEQLAHMQDSGKIEREKTTRPEMFFEKMKLERKIETLKNCHLANEIIPAVQKAHDMAISLRAELSKVANGKKNDAASEILELFDFTLNQLNVTDINQEEVIAEFTNALGVREFETCTSIKSIRAKLVEILNHFTESVRQMEEFFQIIKKTSVLSPLRMNEYSGLLHQITTTLFRAKQYSQDIHSFTLLSHKLTNKLDRYKHEVVKIEERIKLKNYFLGILQQNEPCSGIHFFKNHKVSPLKQEILTILNTHFDCKLLIKKIKTCLQSGKFKLCKIDKKLKHDLEAGIEQFHPLKYASSNAYGK